MQTTIDREKRREYRQKLLNNLSAIVTAVDELDRAAAEARNHLHLHDRFFFQHAANLTEYETYGTNDDLVELYLDTTQVLGRLEKARAHITAVCSLMQFYDYSSNAIFQEFAAREAEHL
ncbi:MAG: hypothetical protein ABSB80_04290 [Methanoregula sp.]|jgi:hypothetical protein|uniref:hypothetical protein n=1 Tax=Methanoregula sp. TaxID=2052170 RepID=UPI003D0B007B